MGLLGDGFRALEGKNTQKHQRRARAAQRKLNVFNAGLKRRAFLRNVRAAQVDNITRFNVSGASFESSGFRGVQESLLTQKQTGLADDLQSGEFRRTIETEQERAIKSAEHAALGGALLDTAQGIGSFS